MSEEQDTGDVNAWMVTFSDLLMLMLTFFVLLLSMSQLDAERLQLLSQSGLHDRGAQEQREGMASPSRESYTQRLAVVDQVASEGSFDYGQVVEELFEVLVVDNILQQNAWLERLPEGIAIAVDGQVAYEQDTAILTAAARGWVRDIGALARTLELGVSVDSWCTPRACSRPWERAIERSEEVVMQLRAEGVSPDRLRMAGYGFGVEADWDKPGVLWRGAGIMPDAVLRFTLIDGEADAAVW